MDIRQLNALVAVADHTTFSAAARALHTVQSNVSNHIARLEAELGVVLVDRNQQRLTDEGELVVSRARRIQNELTSLASDVASLSSEVSGDATLGSIGTTARWLLPALLEGLADAHPAVHLVVRESVTTSLVPRLLTGQLDLAIVHVPRRDPELYVQPLFEEELIVITPSWHALAESTDPASLVELAGEKLLLPPKGTAMRDQLDDIAEMLGVELSPKAEVDGVRLNASLAFSGYGPTIVPATAVTAAAASPDWTTRAIAEGPRREVGLAVTRRGQLSAPARVVHDLCRQVVHASAGDVPGVHPVD